MTLGWVISSHSIRRLQEEVENSVVSRFYHTTRLDVSQLLKGWKYWDQVDFPQCRGGYATENGIRARPLLSSKFCSDNWYITACHWIHSLSMCMLVYGHMHMVSVLGYAWTDSNRMQIFFHSSHHIQSCFHFALADGTEASPMLRPKMLSQIMCCGHGMKSECVLPICSRQS